MANTVVVPSTSANVNKKSLVTSKYSRSFDRTKQNYQLIENQNLQLLAWTVSGKSYLQKDSQKILPSLMQIPEGQGQSLITNRRGVSGLAGVLKEKLIPLNVL